MARSARCRSWWRSTVARWKKSGLTAREFAAREDLSQSTLRWWSSVLNRGTRAQRGSSATQEPTGTAIVPIEIEVPRSSPVSRTRVQIAVGDVVVSAEVGTDPEYLGALCTALGARR